MEKFKGFTDSETFSQLPDSFFHNLLKDMNDVAELKVTLYLIWRVEHMEGSFRALSRMDFNVKDLGLSAEEITRGLEKAVQRGSLLKVQREAAGMAGAGGAAASVYPAVQNFLLAIQGQGLGSVLTTRWKQGGRWWCHGRMPRRPAWQAGWWCMRWGTCWNWSPT